MSAKKATKQPPPSKNSTGSLTVLRGYFDAATGSGSGRFSFADGAILEGEIVDGKVNGLGEFIDPRGIHYQGRFKNTRYDGLGILRRPGLVYQGEFRDGLFDGYGVLKTDDGITYTGEFKTHFFHGYGVLHSSSDNRTYRGEFRMNEKDGLGCEITHDDGGAVMERFCGQFEKDLPRGYGIQLNVLNQWSYGYFEGEDQKGLGLRMDDTDGIFCGEFTAGFPQGLGLTIKTGDFPDPHRQRTPGNKVIAMGDHRQKRIDLGTYHGSLLNGYGARRDYNGDLYHGEFLIDSRHGQGHLEMTCKKTYEGDFRDDRLWGLGQMTYDDGEVVPGLYIDEHYCGKPLSFLEVMTPTSQEGPAPKIKKPRRSLWKRLRAMFFK
jgi:hypothetical protein